MLNASRKTDTRCSPKISSIRTLSSATHCMQCHIGFSLNERQWDRDVEEIVIRELAVNIGTFGAGQAVSGQRGLQPRLQKQPTHLRICGDLQDTDLIRIKILRPWIPRGRRPEFLRGSVFDYVRIRMSLRDFRPKTKKTQRVLFQTVAQKENSTSTVSSIRVQLTKKIRIA